MGHTRHHPSDPTRERLLEAAGEVFAEYGFRQATVREMCRRAGANVAAVNYHFGGKERLYAETLKYGAHVALEKFPPDGGLRRGASPEEALYVFVLSFLKRFLAMGARDWSGKLCAREMVEPTAALDDLVQEVVQPLSQRLHRIVRALLGPKNSLKHDYTVPQAYRTAIPEELYATAFLGERACAYLKDAKADAPFFLMVSFPDPHHPFNPPGKYWDMYRPEQFPVPEAFRRNDWTPPALVANILKDREAGKANLTGMNTIGVTAREAQEARALTAGMIACIDDAVGAVLKALDQSGRRDDTVVIFTSDHGDHLGDHRLMLKGAEQYQSIVRVPFIWSDPQAQKQPKRTDALGSTMDIGATMLEHAKIEPASGTQAKSLLPAIESGAPVRDKVFIQYDSQPSMSGAGIPARVHTLIDERYRLSVFHGTGWGELYDLRDDPGEFDNLWDNPAHAAIRAGMTERLLLTEIEHVDRVPLPTRRA